MAYTADKSEELYSYMMTFFESLSKDWTPVADVLRRLTTPEGGYQVNTQFEQVTFNSQPVTAMIERVQLNSDDGEDTLLRAVLLDLASKLERRDAIPYNTIRHFKEYATLENTIRVKMTGVPFEGPTAAAFVLVVDRLFELRPSYKETLGDKFQIDKDGSEVTRLKAISDSDVQFSHVEVADEQTLVLHFIVLTKEVTDQLA